MATTVFARPPADRSAGTADSRRQYWASDTASAGSTSIPIAMPTRTTRGASAQNGGVSTTVAGPAQILTGRYVTDPLAADVTISGTITWNWWGSEANMAANTGLRCEIFRLQPNGTVTSIGASTNTTELGTAVAARSANITPTSTDFKAGDSIGIAIYAVDAGGTMGAGHIINLRVNGPTAAADGDSFVTFTETFTFISFNAPAGTTLYLTNSAADAGSGKAIQIGGTAPGSYSLNGNTTTGPTAPVIFSDAPNWWTTPPLNAATIDAGLVRLNLDMFESSTLANAAFMVEIYQSAIDFSNQVLLLKYWGNGNVTATATEITTTSADATETYNPAMQQVVLSDGDRLLFALYLDDALNGTTVQEFGATTSGADMATGFTVTFSGPGSIQLRNTVTEYVPPTGPPPYLTRREPALTWR